MNETKGEKCCPPVPTGEKKSGIAGLLAGLGAAFLATLCCFGPLVGLALGISGAAALTGVAKYQPVMVVAAIGIIGLISLYSWRKNRQFWKPFLVSLATFGVALWLIYQVFIPLLSHKLTAEPAKPTAEIVSQVSAGASSSKLMRTSFAVEGMSCASCAVTIERTLSELPGVKTAKVSYGAKTATVVYDGKTVDAGRLTNAIAKVGYRAKPIGSGAL